MTMNQTLLVELLTEELPPKALAKLGDAFAAAITDSLNKAGLLEAGSHATAYATPRRLAVSISEVRAISPDKTIREKVLPVSVALDAAGHASAPLIKKLAALATQHGLPAIELAQLERAADGKADSFFHTFIAPGVPLAAGLQHALQEACAKLPIPKLMSYQRPDGSTVQFVRPAHKLLALHGSQVVPVAILGLTAGRHTLGHRFLAHKELNIESAGSYAQQLERDGKVIAGFATRKEQIRAALLEKSGADQVLMPDALLDEVCALVEWPVVYECHFEPAFLAVLDTASPEHIIGGNERVVRPRLSDAKFFFEQDQKKTLASRIPLLANVVYHNKLGSQKERTDRVQALAGSIAAMLGADRALAERGALLAKADLLTDMVGEFPELQGIMGTYYARHDGEPDEVALAASEHYQPRFAGDALPQSSTGTVVALADKLETLVGIWGIGLHPTGDKDPFALRRHALGVLRILIEKRLPLSLSQLLDGTAAQFAGIASFSAPTADVVGFLFDRLRGLLRERGFSGNEIEAVLALAPDRLDDIIERLQAVQDFAALAESASLAAANKRITNILKKTEVAPGAVDGARLVEAAEQALYAALLRVSPQAEQALARGDFGGTLTTLAQLRDEVDGFFNGVMVMADDLALRNNRLALLSQLHRMMNQVADISKLAQ